MWLLRAARSVSFGFWQAGHSQGLFVTAAVRSLCRGTVSPFLGPCVQANSLAVRMTSFGALMRLFFRLPLRSWSPLQIGGIWYCHLIGHVARTCSPTSHRKNVVLGLQGSRTPNTVAFFLLRAARKHSGPVCAIGESHVRPVRYTSCETLGGGVQGVLDFWCHALRTNFKVQGPPEHGEG